MKKYLIIILLIPFFITGQEKETIHLVFKKGMADTCYSSPYKDGNENKKSNYVHKLDKGKFILCGENFSVKNHLVDTITMREFNSLKKVTIDYFKRRREAAIKEKQLNQKDWFYKIYILEELPDGRYLQSEVNWVDPFLTEVID